MQPPAVQDVRVHDRKCRTRTSSRLNSHIPFLEARRFIGYNVLNVTPILNDKLFLYMTFDILELAWMLYEKSLVFSYLNMF